MMKYADEAISRVFARTGGRCFYCGMQLILNACGSSSGKGAWDLDSFIPALETDKDPLENLVPACATCGTVKNGIFPWDFDSRRFRQGDGCAGNYLHCIPCRGVSGSGQP